MGRKVTAAEREVKIGRYSVRLSNASIILELLVIAELCGGISAALECMNGLASVRMTFGERGNIFERILAIVLGARHGFEGKSPLYVDIGERSYSGVLALTDNREYFVRMACGMNFVMDCLMTMTNLTQNL